MKKTSPTPRSCLPRHHGHRPRTGQCRSRQHAQDLRQRPLQNRSRKVPHVDTILEGTTRLLKRLVLRERSVRLGGAARSTARSPRPLTSATGWARPSSQPSRSADVSRAASWASLRKRGGTTSGQTRTSSFGWSPSGHGLNWPEITTQLFCALWSPGRPGAQHIA